MVATSQLVKRIDDCIVCRDCQMDIDGSTIDRTVAEARFQGKKIHAILIAVGGISVAQVCWVKSQVFGHIWEGQEYQ